MKNSLLRKIKKIQKIDPNNYSIELIFENGEKRKVSLSQYFSHPKGLAAEIIRGNLFKKCFIEMGALAWPNGLEFCPDSLLILSKEQEDQSVA